MILTGESLLLDRQGSSPNSQQPTTVPHTRQMQSNMKPSNAVRKFSKPTAVQTESSASQLLYRQKFQQANCCTDRNFSKPTAVQTESSASQLQYRQKFQQANCSTDRKFSKPIAVHTESSASQLLYRQKDTTSLIYDNSILIHLS